MENRYCLQMVSCSDGCGTGNSGTGAENVYSTEETRLPGIKLGS